MPSNKKRNLFSSCQYKGYSINFNLFYRFVSQVSCIDYFFILSLNFYAKQNIIEFFQNRRNFNQRYLFPVRLCQFVFFEEKLRYMLI